MDNILAFGASILYGAWDREGGWVSRLRKYVDEKNSENLDESSCFVYNLGISGDSSQDLLSRFDMEAKARIGNNEESLFIISIGVNDCMLDNETGLNNVPKENYIENLQKIINLAGKYSGKVIFMGFFPVNETKVDPIPWRPGCSYKNEYIEQYNGAMESVAEENKIPFINLYKKFSNLDYRKLLKDGVHPNSEGHELIFETIKNFLVENKLV